MPLSTSSLVFFLWGGLVDWLWITMVFCCCCFFKFSFSRSHIKKAHNCYPNFKLWWQITSQMLPFQPLELCSVNTNHEFTEYSPLQKRMALPSHTCKCNIMRGKDTVFFIFSFKANAVTKYWNIILDTFYVHHNIKQTNKKN